MLAHFDKVVRIDFRINKDSPLLVGVSGGPDSLCLLDLLVKCGYAVIVAHLDHGLRPEAGGEARRVELLAASLGLEFVLEHAAVQALADSAGMSIEQAARQARYDFLFAQAAKLGAQAVVVGHNADDQVETLLMHFLQGSGLDGLTGMQAISLPNPWSDEISLLRPLLSTWREQILAYCQDNNLEPQYDLSNADTQFFRNRIRHELLPVLDEYAPGVRGRLVRMADLMRADQAVLEAALEGARKTTVRETGAGYLAFDALSLEAQPLAIQRRLIRWGMTQLRSDIRDLDYAAVERALSLLEAAGNQSVPGQQDLALGVRALIEGDLFYLASWDADLPGRGWPQIAATLQGLDIHPPANIILSDGWTLKAEIISFSEALWDQIQINRQPLRAWLDLGEQVPTLICRARRPGDRMAPLGMAGKSKKLSDLMIDTKIPQRARQRWPLVCRGEEILWLPGVQQAHGTGVRPDSQWIAFLQVIPPRRS
jgi:tRNA(Ile)-lysidine synthase